MFAQAHLKTKLKKESIQSSARTELLLRRSIWYSILADINKTISRDLNFDLSEYRNF